LHQVCDCGNLQKLNWLRRPIGRSWMFFSHSYVRSARHTLADWKLNICDCKYMWSSRVKTATKSKDDSQKEISHSRELEKIAALQQLSISFFDTAYYQSGSFPAAASTISIHCSADCRTVLMLNLSLHWIWWILRYTLEFTSKVKLQPLRWRERTCTVRRNLAWRQKEIDACALCCNQRL
jgi:hypothetical protein